MISSLLHKTSLTLKMIKFQHSIFALPFALSSFFVATQGQINWISLLWIILAMVTARNAAMSFNRIVDRDIDAQNPRTESREIPSGKLSLGFAKGFCVINCLLFVLIAYQFNPLTFILSPAALMIVLGYSLTKRFTHATQLFLGLSLGIAPIATWIAMTGQLSAYALYLGAGVFFWVAGFDLIYSCLDENFDRQNNLKNLVVKWGTAKALWIARLFHVFTLILFVFSGWSLQMGWVYYTGLGLMSLLMIYEHNLVKPSDLSKLNMAFFTMNGYVSILFLVTTLLELYLY